jgi:hypothetical protein
VSFPELTGSGLQFCDSRSGPIMEDCRSAIVGQTRLLDHICWSLSCNRHRGLGVLACKVHGSKLGEEALGGVEQKARGQACDLSDSRDPLNFPSSGGAGGFLVLPFGDEPHGGAGDQAAGEEERQFHFQFLGLKSAEVGEIVESGRGETYCYREHHPVDHDEGHRTFRPRSFPLRPPFLIHREHPHKLTTSPPK